MSSSKSTHFDKPAYPLKKTQSNMKMVKRPVTNDDMCLHPPAKKPKKDEIKLNFDILRPKPVPIDEQSFKPDLNDTAWNLNSSHPGASTAKASKKPTCSACFKQYADMYKLRRHFRAVHLGERPHRCSVCDMAFSENAS